jgi:hypothetical protein
VTTTYLHEAGGNRSLFGEDRFGRPYRARRVREDVEDFDDGENGGKTVRGAMADAGDDSDESESYETKRDLLDEALARLEQEGDEEDAEQFRQLLKRHRARQWKGAAVGAVPGGEVVAGQGVAGPGGKLSRESRAWMYKLRHGESLLEARRRSRVSERWMGRLLIEKRGTSLDYER